MCLSWPSAISGGRIVVPEPVCKHREDCGFKGSTGVTSGAPSPFRLVLICDMAIGLVDPSRGSSSCNLMSSRLDSVPDTQPSVKR